MRVVAGELRGRRISAPLGKKTRPTTDKAREATFNALGSLGVIVGARVVDAFAGSGALGIEALSRVVQSTVHLSSATVRHLRYCEKISKHLDFQNVRLLFGVMQ